MIKFERKGISPQRVVFTALILFVFSFGFLALFINSNDTNAFNLQQMGIESLVERGHFYLEGSRVPQLQPMGDTFLYNGHVYAAKQPGQFVIGSAVYFLLRLFGVSYMKNYTLAGGLVTLFTSVPMTAAMMALVFLIVFHITGSQGSSIMIAFFTGLGTILFPYSGVTHHDVFGTFFSFLAFFLLFYNYRIRRNNGHSHGPSLPVFLAGFFSGFSLFSSLLQLAPVMSIALYVLLFRRRKDIVLFAAAFLVGILPMLVFNWSVFGNPLTFPNIAGHFSDTMPHFNLRNILKKVFFYMLSPSNAVFFYSPVFAFSLGGLFRFPEDLFPEKTALLACVLLLLCHICTMETFGGSQFGPRYLLPAMPFGMIGLAGYFSRKKDGSHVPNLIRNIVMIAGVVSIIICATGSLMGVMYHKIYMHAFPVYLRRIMSGHLPLFEFIYPGLFLIALSFVLYFFRIFSIHISPGQGKRA